MKVLVSPDRIAYRIPDRDAFEALVKRLELPGDPVAKNLRQLLGIQAVGLDGRTGSDCRHNWQLYGSVSWLEHNEYGLVPVVGDIDHRWGQVRQLDPSVERDAVKNLCNGKVKKTKGGWSYKGGGKIGPPLFPEAQIADGASLGQPDFGIGGWMQNHRRAIHPRHRIGQACRRRDTRPRRKPAPRRHHASQTKA